MNETLNDQGHGPNPGPGPAAPPPHQDLDRLRRSTSNRYIAGVAGGLGRHFNIDPTILRVLLVVLTFFGGAGLVIYAVCWLLVPKDTDEHAKIRVGSEPRKILLLAAAAIAFLLAAGDAVSGFDAGWPLVSIAVIIAIVMVIRDRGRGAPVAGSGGDAGASSDTVLPSGSAVSSGGTGDPAGTAGVPAYSSGVEHTQVLPGQGQQPPAWQPPVARQPMIPPRPKRTGIIWFWPTLALIAVGLGLLGLYDNNHDVADGAYPALALAITAVMLIVGSVVGRPGGLILLGFLSSLALVGSVVVGGSFGVDAKEIHESPTTAAQVRGDYRTPVGEIVLDLTGVSDPQALAGREIDVHLRTGHIDVIVPRSINVDIDAKMDFAGGITVPGNDGGGFNHKTEKYLAAVPASSAAPLELDLDAKFGQITVEYR